MKKYTNELLKRILVIRQKNLDNFLKEKKISNEKFAEKIGCSARTISRYRTGETPIGEVSKEIAAALEITDEAFSESVILFEKGQPVIDLGIDECDILQEEQMEEMLMDNFEQALKESDLHVLNLIADNRTAFLEICYYEWIFIKYALILGNSDIESVKTFMFQYSIYAETFINCINVHNTVLYEIKSALNKKNMKIKKKIKIR